MILNLVSIGNAKPFDINKLEFIEHEFTEKDCEWYDKMGWKYYNPKDFQEYLLPSLNKPISLYRNCSLTEEKLAPIVEIKGRKYKVLFNDPLDSDPWEASGKSLVLEETDKELTQSNYNGDRPYLKFFGQPRWVQCPYFPSDLNGDCCYHFLTIENGWGDSGNYNILLGFNGDIPNIAYFEASCC